MDYCGVYLPPQIQKAVLHDAARIGRPFLNKVFPEYRHVKFKIKFYLKAMEEASLPNRYLK